MVCAIHTWSATPQCLLASTTSWHPANRYCPFRTCELAGTGQKDAAGTGRRRIPCQPPPIRKSVPLLADFLAHHVFLLVEGLLVELGDMAIVHVRHVALFLANVTIVRVQHLCLGLGDLAILRFVVDALVLIGQAVVHLDAARVILVPLAGRV